MKCLFLDGVKHVSLQEREVPSLGARDVLVRLESRGICGTDLASYRTGTPNGFGHEMAGVVVKAGHEASIAVGTRVFVSNLAAQGLVGYAPELFPAYLGGFAEYIAVRDAELGTSLFGLPDTMSFSEGALVEPFCVSMSGVRKAHAHKGSKVVILGAGIIGLLAHEYLRTQGVRDIVVADINEHRLALAAEAGAMVCNTREVDLREFLTETLGHGFSALGDVPDVDLFIDAAGVGPLVSAAVEMAKYQAELVVLASHRQPAEIDLHSLMYNNLRIYGSIMFDPDDIVRAIDLISANPRIGQHLISHEIAFERAAEAFAIADDPNQSLKVMMVREA